MKTKYVNICYSVLTRVEYTETLEVPETFDSNDLHNLADHRYGNLDGGEFVDDPDYWERGSTTIEEIEEGEVCGLVPSVQKMGSEFVIE